MLRVFKLTARTNSEPGQAEAVVGHTWCGALTSDEVSSALWVPEPRGGRAKAFGFRRGHNMERGRPSRDGAADWRLVTPYFSGAHKTVVVLVYRQPTPLVASLIWK